MNADGFLDAQRARQLAADLLAETLPRRWSHTIAVAIAAEDLSSALTVDGAEEIVCAAWLHDIGYAPGLIDTGFHPLDGAAYLARDVAGRQNISPEVISLVAHHTGAAYEARERGLQDLLASYPQPDETKLAILSCADLCSGPDGAPVDPAERISEVLARYPTIIQFIEQSPSPHPRSSGNLAASCKRPGTTAACANSWSRPGMRPSRDCETASH